MITFYLERVSSVMTPVARRLQRSVAEYFQQNFYVTPSGMFSNTSLLHAMQTLGADHIMYSVDYPYVQQEGARSFLENAALSEADKHKIGYQNVKRLFRL